MHISKSLACVTKCNAGFFIFISIIFFFAYNEPPKWKDETSIDIDVQSIIKKNTFVPVGSTLIIK